MGAVGKKMTSPSASFTTCAPLAKFSCQPALSGRGVGGRRGPGKSKTIKFYGPLRPEMLLLTHIQTNIQTLEAGAAAVASGSRRRRQTGEGVRGGPLEMGEPVTFARNASFQVADNKQFAGRKKFSSCVIVVVAVAL